ncbi:MAG: phosphatase PAP2 family protein [Clostridia bacterium]|nr:phosphatase PAP2 family protein [Clostridia bacterium]
MSFLYALESIRNPVLDAFFSVITMFGEETIFMAVGMIVFWCINKYQGYFLLSIGFIGTVLNQFLKMFFRIPRPWVRDPNFTIVSSAKEAASGYSFPSGHTQTSVGLFGGLARWNKHTTLRAVTLALCVLVPFSRLYLGVHTPADVGVSLAVAALLIFVGCPLFKKAEQNPKIMYAILIGMTVFVVAFLCFVCFYPFPAEVYAADAIHNLESAQKNAFTLTGCALGMIVVYTVDHKYLHFETKAVWWAQILKAAGGIIAVLFVKEVLRFPIDALIPHALIARLVRYFLMVIMAGVVWPMTFRFFAKLGNKS